MKNKTLFFLGIIGLLLQTVLFLEIFKQINNIAILQGASFYMIMAALFFIGWIASIFLLRKSLNDPSYKIYLTLLIISMINIFRSFGKGDLNLLGGLSLLGGTIMILISIIGIIKTKENKNESNNISIKKESPKYVWIIPLITTVLIIPISLLFNAITRPEGIGFMVAPLIIILLFPFINLIIVSKKSKEENASNNDWKAFFITWGFQIIWGIIIFVLEGPFEIEPSKFLYP